MKIKNWLVDSCYLFGWLGVVLIPFSLHLTNLNERLTVFLFENMLGYFLDESVVSATGISSDSTAMYVLVLLLVIIAVIISTTLVFSKKWHNKRQFILSTLQVIFSYYLAFVMLRYGFDKVFKAQFYLPEPNILFTPFGQLDKDILYWSTMGTSYHYSVFAGSLELFAAILLLFYRTRLVGVLMTIGIMTNVLAINFSFDISVKLFSFFLFFLAWLIVSPFMKTLYQFFIQQQSVSISPIRLPFSMQPAIRVACKIFIIGVFLLECLYPFFINNNWNDDIAARPYLHGAYEIRAIKQKQLPFKRFFIHRNGYLIFQNQADEMLDFELKVDAANRQLILTDYNQQNTIIPYQHNDDLLTLELSLDGKVYLLNGKAIHWQDLPALQDSFHWRMDDF